MDNQQSSYHITLITLVSALIGFLSMVSNPLFSLLYLVVVIGPKFKEISSIHSWIKISSFTSTTFIFGLIDGFTYNSISAYFADNQNELIPVFSIYLSLLTVYHYF